MRGSAGGAGARAATAGTAGISNAYAAARHSSLSSKLASCLPAWMMPSRGAGRSSAGNVLWLAVVAAVAFGLGYSWRTPTPHKSPAASLRMPAQPDAAAADAAVDSTGTVAGGMTATRLQHMTQELDHLRSMRRIMGASLADRHEACVSMRYPFARDELHRSESQEFKNKIMTMFRVNYDLDVFVETGTYEGGTIATQLPSFQHLYTIELSDLYFSRAVERFKNARDKVHLIQGDAAVQLGLLLPKLDAPALFWLDGHYSQGNTAQGNMDTPIIYEISALMKWEHVTDSVILVDDVRLFSGYEDDCHHAAECYPSADDVRAAVCAAHPELNVDVFGGMMLIYPTKRQLRVPLPRLPPTLIDEFTLNGRVPMLQQYSNDASTPGGKPLTVTYTAEHIREWMADAKKQVSKYYGATDQHLFKLLARHPLEGKRVVIMGSLEPWYESIALAYGAESVLTVEYGDRVMEDPRLTAVKPADFYASNARFDVIFSISSFEHDGLGRYGDPLQGDGDLRAMRAMLPKLAPGGVLLLTVPMGSDALVYNVHRIYGHVRWPLLTEGFSIVDSEGVTDSMWQQPLGNFAQPVWLLAPAA